MTDSYSVNRRHKFSFPDFLTHNSMASIKELVKLKEGLLHDAVISLTPYEEVSPLL